MAGLQGDPWRISPEERAKHDAQFFQLKPVGGFVTGEQAKGFFLQSGLPMPILGQIWGLADLNADGKMDKKEFSIAMHLIAKKLQGTELPRSLPASLKADPVSAPMGMAPSTGFSTLPLHTQPPSFHSQGYSTLPSMGLVKPAYHSGMGGAVPGGVGGFGTGPQSFPSAGPTPPQSAPGADWAIPQHQRMRYSQMFTTEDRSRKGHLSGMEAKGVLSRTGLSTNILAQIWNLADLDSDGKLTADEFYVCMYLVDLAKSGQPIPGKLPPELIPPSYRRGGVGVGAPPASGGIAAAGMPPQGHTPQKDSFGDLLSGINMGVPASMPPPDINPEPEILPSVIPAATFEDKRKENFDKGQAELERRRAMLQEEQRKMEEERLAAEKAEHEKREKKRLEQERKKQMELEKQMEKQRQLEQEREEARRKALEQREAARRELERQRQLEWERQRRGQLMAEKARERDQVDRVQSEVGQLKLELEAQDNRKVELHSKIEQARTTVTDLTSTIDSMRVSRDIKLADIEKLEQEVQGWQTKLGGIQYERQQLDIKVQAQTASMDDTYKTVMHSFNSKRERVDKLREQLRELEEQTGAKQKEIDASSSRLNEINNKLNDLQTSNNLLQDTLKEKINSWNDIKAEKEAEKNQAATQVNGFSSWGFDQPAASTNTSMATSSSAQSLQNAWASFSMTTSTTSASANNNKEQDKWSSAFEGFDMFNSKPGSLNTTPTSQPTTAAHSTPANASGNLFDAPEVAKSSNSAFGTIPQTIVSPPSSNKVESSTSAAWASFDAKSDLFSSPPQSSSSQSAWADSVFSNSQGSVGSAGNELAGATRYLAMFQFDARNPDELSLSPGDAVMVKADQSGAEPGWMSGVCNGREGWFPEAYVSLDEGAAAADPVQAQSSQDIQSPQDGFGSDVFENNVAGGGDAQPPTSLQSAESSFTAVSTIPSGSPTPGQGQCAPDGLQAQALYPWKAKKENHLTFNKGDIILIKEQQDMWWSGELDGNIGWFPKSYVKLIGASAVLSQPDDPIQDVSTPPQVDISSPQEQTVQTPTSPLQAGSLQGEAHTAMFAYQSAEAGDLTFNQGDTILVTVKDGDWWTGTLDGRTGIFPANYVKKCEETPEREVEPAGTSAEEEKPQSPGQADTQMPSTQKLSSTKKPEIASVIAPYQATGPEQLSLTPGQLILVRKKSPSGWWEGELQARGQKRKVGWFPANYVSLRGGSSARTTPDGQRASPHKSLSPTPQPFDQGSRSATPVSYPQPTTAPALEQVCAMYNYAAQKSDELTFHKGSVINVINKDDPDWWKGELNGATGVFPSNYVSQLSEVAETTPTSWFSADQSFFSEKEQKRQNAIHELIDTEEAYMSDLLLVRDVFYKPFNADKVLTDEDKQTIFVNWKELVMCNTKLLKALRVRKKMSKNQSIHMVGDILCENIPHMTPYIRFCSCQLNAAIMIQKKTENDKKFQDAHKRCWMDTRTKGMPLSSFLLKPMQRITKYPLLIEKVLQHTETQHHDHQSLQDALSRAQELCAQVNEGVREKENSDRLEWIQTHVICEGLPEKISFNTVTNCLGPRKYLHSGTLYKAKSGKELVGFLFNDFLLLTQPQKSMGNVTTVFSFDIKANFTFKMYRNPIFLNEIMIKQSSVQESQENDVLFHLHHIERVYSLKAINKSEKDKWIKTIESASKLYLDTERKRREKAHAARRELSSTSVGRLMVMILEGIDLSKNDERARMNKSKGCGRLLVIVIEGDHLIPSDVNAKKSPTVGRLLVVIREGSDLASGEDGKSDPYCEVSMGAQEHKTKVINNTLNPKWNSSMQFTIKDLQEDVLCITVYDRDLFTPNDFLGRTEVRVEDILSETRASKGPISKRLPLHEVDSGEVHVKLDLQLFQN